MLSVRSRGTLVLGAESRPGRRQVTESGAPAPRSQSCEPELGGSLAGRLGAAAPPGHTLTGRPCPPQHVGFQRLNGKRSRKFWALFVFNVNLKRSIFRAEVWGAPSDRRRCWRRRDGCRVLRAGPQPLAADASRRSGDGGPQSPLQAPAARGGSTPHSRGTAILSSRRHQVPRELRRCPAGFTASGKPVESA